MTGRSLELSEILKKREINICCIQETKWKGSKSRDIGHGYQLVYHGTETKRNGVAVALDQDLKQRIINIERKSDRLIAIKLALDSQPVLNVISAYAPQTGCPAPEKQAFWEDFDELMQNIPQGEKIHIGGDLNGHVGAKSDIFRGVHGGYGYGTVNQQGTEILNFASKHNLKIINTQFQKKPEHLITYKCANHATQIDYVLSTTDMSKRYNDCKVIPGEAITAQHRLLVAVLNLPYPIKTHPDKTKRIKWKEIHSPKGTVLIKAIEDYLKTDLCENKNANTMWANFEDFCQMKAQQTLGVSRGGLATNKDTTWWNNGVKDIIKAKRDAFKVWQKYGLEEDHMEYRKIKSIAKAAAAQSRAASRQSFYDRLENAENENDIYKIARQGHRSTLDIQCNKYIKNKLGHLLTSNDAINNRWKEYFEELLNEEFPSESLPHLPPVCGPINHIQPDEIKKAISNMKCHKAMGPDNIPADLWKKTWHHIHPMAYGTFQ
ncbi:uncharacterized protein LOC134674852 [Cydia fagiglandana]|uniref:uncharacterized protein LOC134674852 n=1 Tax=Cydia fagiglandana TaxID=1458189 RepID=UPI002FEE57B8